MKTELDSLRFSLRNITPEQFRILLLALNKVDYNDYRESAEQGKKITKRFHQSFPEYLVPKEEILPELDKKEFEKEISTLTSELAIEFLNVSFKEVIDRIGGLGI